MNWTLIHDCLGLAIYGFVCVITGVCIGILVLPRGVCRRNGCSWEDEEDDEDDL